MTIGNKKISFEIKEDKAFIGFGYSCKKRMTILDEETMREFEEILEEVKGKEKHLKGALFFSHKDVCFLAGADINLINSLQTEAEAIEGAQVGQKVYTKIEDLKTTTVACIHGICLGGGLELALSCDQIIVSDDSQTILGLPEVKLGILPGFGGTYRMPRKVGLVKGLDAILTGRSIRAKSAKKMGLADGVYPKENLLKMAESHFKKKRKIVSENYLLKKIIFQKARENVLKKTKGFYQGPLKILDTIEGGMMKGRSSYMDLEAQSFAELVNGEQSKNLRHIFALVEGSKKNNFIDGSENLSKLKRGACLGGGTMGGGIAWLMAENGMKPILKDISWEACELGLKQASKNFKGN